MGRPKKVTGRSAKTAKVTANQPTRGRGRPRKEVTAPAPKRQTRKGTAKRAELTSAENAKLEAAMKFLAQEMFRWRQAIEDGRIPRHILSAARALAGLEAEDIFLLRAEIDALKAENNRIQLLLEFVEARELATTDKPEKHEIDNEQ